MPPEDNVFKSPEELAEEYFEAEIERRRESRREQDIEILLSLPEFRRWLYEIFQSCQIYNSAFRAGDVDAWQAAYRDGQRTAGMMLLQRAQDVMPAVYKTLEKEYEAFKLKEDEDYEREHDNITELWQRTVRPKLGI